MAADDVRAELAEVLWREDTGPTAPPLTQASPASQRVYARTASALLPVVDRIAREAAGKALREAADDWDANTNHACDAPAELRARADAADGGTT